MRIWVLTNEYADNFIGGLGVVATQIANDLHEQGHEITVLSKTQKSRIEVSYEERLQVIRFPEKSRYMTPRKSIFLSIPIDQYVRRQNIKSPELIHVHSLQCFRLAAFYKRKYKVPLVYTCHSLITVESKNRKIKPKKSLFQQRSLFRLADVITVPSQWLKTEIKKYYPRYARKVQVIPNGVHIPGEGADELAIVKNFKKNIANQDQLLFVGRLNPVKGIEELIHAIALLKKEKPWIRLYVVGEGPESYTKRLKRIVIRRGLRSNIRWLGKLQPEQVRRMYGSFSAVVVPSKNESFGLVALEVMASGVPLVSTRNGGLASFVNHHNATIIKYVTPRSIANGILRMWRNTQINHKLHHAYTTAKKYEWKRSSEKYNQLFSTIIQK